jgi:hypothetical protein
MRLHWRLCDLGQCSRELDREYGDRVVIRDPKDSSLTSHRSPITDHIPTKFRISIQDTEAASVPLRSIAGDQPPPGTAFGMRGHTTA